MARTHETTGLGKIASFVPVNFIVMCLIGVTMRDGKDIEKMERVVDFCQKVVNGEHEDSEDCWCCPEVEEYDNGNKLIIHNDAN